MAKYEITDNKTGKTVVVEGQKPPTTTDAEAIFQKAGLRQTSPEPEKGLASKVTDFLIPRTKEYLGKEMSNPKTLSNSSLSEVAYESIPVLNLLTNLENGKIKLDKQGLGTAGEVASFMIPANKLLKGAGALSKIAGGALQGAEIGLTSGITDPEANNIKERIQKGVTSGLVGGVTGGAVQGLFEVGKAGAKSLVGDAAQKISKIIRPNNVPLNKFKDNTDMNFADEIVKRDAKNIEGMGYSELQNYFTKKFEVARQKVDKLLEGRPETIKRDWIQQQMLDILDGIKGMPDTAKQVNSKFTDYFDLLEKFGDDIPVSTANSIKRDIQGMANWGTASKEANNAVKNLSRKVKEKIKDIVPEVDALNKETQLYRLVKDAVKNTATNESKKISTTFWDKLFQSVPAVAGAGVGAYTGNPLAGIGTAVLGAGASKAREVYRSPEVQTRLASMISKGVSPSLKALERVLENTTRKGASIFSTRN